MFTSKIKNIFLILIISFIFFFLFYHFKPFLFSQRIFLDDFQKSNFLVIENNSFLLVGKVPNSKKFFINNREIFLDQDYSFQERVYLSDYQNTFRIKSISKTGPISEKEIIIYKIPTENKEN